MMVGRLATSSTSNLNLPLRWNIIAPSDLAYPPRNNQLGSSANILLERRNWKNQKEGYTSYPSQASCESTDIFGWQPSIRQ